jgi:hypothetical protein
MGKFHHSYDERILPNCLPYTDATLDSISVNREMVKKQLLELNISKGSGEDGITNRMLHLAADSSCDPPQLFQKLVLNNIFPNCWKIGRIVPVDKNKNSKTSVTIDLSLCLMHYLKFLSVLFFLKYF